MEANYIRFLGTAGARFVMARQLRYSAGTLICIAGRSLILDPGPGTLLRCAKSRPRIDTDLLDGVVLTHNHIDHTGDVNALLDAMTHGGLRRCGHLFATAECLHGESAVVLPYIRNHVESVTVLEPETDYALGPLSFSTTVRHTHTAETYGLKFRNGHETVAFMVDTHYFDGLVSAYADADVLVINVVREGPFNTDTIMHLTVEDARRVIAGVRPRKAFLTHLGMTILKAGPHKIARRLTDELGIAVTAAEDGMTVPLEP